jgi:hypothetical protein
MRKILRVKYIAAEIHALLFISVWVLYAIFSQPVMNGPSSLPFLIVFIADLPISLVAFGVMFTRSEMGTIAEVRMAGLTGSAAASAVGEGESTQGRAVLGTKSGHGSLRKEAIELLGSFAGSEAYCKQQ